MDTVKLYYFEGYDFHDDRVVRSRRPATAEFIARMAMALRERLMN